MDPKNFCELVERAASSDDVIEIDGIVDYFMTDAFNVELLVRVAAKHPETLKEIVYAATS